MILDVIALAEARPNLKIVIEHISTKEACEVVRKYSNVSCTVTPQHLIYDDADIRK
jgi:dihydroorotase